MTDHSNFEIAQIPAIECQTRGGLSNVQAKLRGGERVRVAYFGGSITQAAGWRVHMHVWLQESFSSTKVEMIHAAIGGTGSDLGVFRLERDVLAFSPDLVFVEFAVNDSGADPVQIMLAMEGIVRKIRRHNPCCDICFVYTLASDMTATLRDSVCPSAMDAHELVAEYYGIPSVNFGLEIVRLEAEGTLVFTADAEEKVRLEAAGKVVFARDGCHPHEEGHRLYSQVLQRAFVHCAQVGTPGPVSLPASRDPRNWETARMAPFESAQPTGDCRRLSREEWPEIAWSADTLDVLWQVDGAGSGFTVRFTGTGLGFSDVIGPDSGQLEVIVDGQPHGIISRFNMYCTYYMPSYCLVVDGLPTGEHEVRLMLHPDVPDKAVMLARNNLVIDNLARFTASRWYPSAILVLGTVSCM